MVHGSSLYGFMASTIEFLVQFLPLVRVTEALQTEFAPTMQQRMEQRQRVDGWQWHRALKEEKKYTFFNNSM